MHPIIQEIEDVLRNEYPIGFGRIFIGIAQRDEMTVGTFKEAIGLNLPDIFYEYYEWLMQVVFENADVSAQARLDYDDSKYFSFSLENILTNTQDWQGLQKYDPSREWKFGFVAIVSWNSSYEMVIDTKGEVGKAGSILYFDFKGGSEYIIKYENFEAFLKTKLELLKAKLYFPPNYEVDSEAYDDFMDGEVRKKIELIEKTLNGRIWKRVNI